MTRGIRPHRTNRFIRFGYRRPPPWKPPKIRKAPSTRPQHLRDPEVYSSWRELRNQKAQIHPLPSNQDPSVVPALAHGIHVVLRGDGIYPLEAPWLKKRHKNYSDSLRKIVQPANIAWSNIPGYIPAASDSTLHNVAEQHGALFSSSTSSITPTISAMYHLLSNFRNTGLQGGLSARVRDLPSDFSKFHRRPVAFTITRNGTGGTYSINAHEGLSPGPSILRDLGHSMERMLTTPPQEFKRKFVLSGSGSDADSEVIGPSGTEEQFFHYSRISNFVLRAQIDCRNPDTGEVFDVKTRAVAPIRYDLENYRAHTSHRLRFLQGPSDSYEREFYDMVRTVFLKYALQLRIGRMSGALVAYHNTTEVLGLEYISLKEIESYVFGSQYWADIAFGTAVKLVEEVAETVLRKMSLGDGEKLKVVLSTEWSQLKMHIFAQRIRNGQDPLACDQLFSERPTEAKKSYQKDNFYVGGMWHVDASFHGAPMGVSIVGAHPLIEKMGGQRVSPRSAALTKRKRTIDEGRLKGIAKNVSHMSENDLQAWEMKVVPFVNNEITSKTTFSMEKSDSFRLKYNLTELSVNSDVIEKFLVSLGRIYVK